MNEIDGILSEIKQNIRGTYRAIYHSSKFSAKILKDMFDAASKGKISKASVTEYENFLNHNEGRVRNASIPVREDRAELVKQLFDKELELESATKPKEIRQLKMELSAIRSSIPELKELDQREIEYYLFPKVKGDTNRIQISVAEKDLSKFYDWLQEHLETNLSSDDLTMSEFSVFTDNQYQFYKLPFEGEELESLVDEMRSFKLNPHLLQDLKEGDYEGWLAIPDADSGRTLSFLKAKGISYTKSNKQEYFRTSERNENEVLTEMLAADPGVEYTASSNSNYVAGLETDDSHNYAMYLTNENCERITIPGDYVKEGFAFSTMQEEYGPNGYFAVRRPETYGEDSQVILFDRNRVFQSNDKKDYDVFVYKNEAVPVIAPGEQPEQATLTRLAALEVSRQFEEAKKAAEKIDEMAKEAMERASGLMKDTAKDIIQDLSEQISL